jgi:hypothetical protein
MTFGRGHGLLSSPPSFSFLREPPRKFLLPKNPPHLRRTITPETALQQSKALALLLRYVHSSV